MIAVIEEGSDRRLADSDFLEAPVVARVDGKTRGAKPHGSCPYHDLDGPNDLGKVGTQFLAQAFGKSCCENCSGRQPHARFLQSDE